MKNKSFNKILFDEISFKEKSWYTELSYGKKIS